MSEKLVFHRGEATSRRYGRIVTSAHGLHDVVVTGDVVPEVHLDDVLLPPPGEVTRHLGSRPGRLEVVGHGTGVLSQGGFGVTRGGRAVLVELGERRWTWRLTRITRRVLTRLGHGEVVSTTPGGDVRVHDAADALDVAVGVALWRGVEPNVLSLLPAR